MNVATITALIALIEPISKAVVSLYSTISDIVEKSSELSADDKAGLISAIETAKSGVTPWTAKKE
jgi:hypothetical protein